MVIVRRSPFGSPWNVDVNAMVMGKVEDGSRMTSVEDSLENIAYENTRETGAEQTYNYSL